LRNLLETAFGGAQVAAFQPDIGIHHADQGQAGKMIALGHQLCPDNDIDRSRFHLVDEIGGLLRRPDRVRGDNRGPCLRKQHLDLVADPLDPGSAGHQTVLVAAFRAFFRDWHDMAAMVAGEPSGQAMFDHPGGTVGAVDPVTAGPAQGERRKAAPVEEQQRLFAALEILLQRLDQSRCQPVAARRHVLREVQRLDIGHRCTAETRGQFEQLVIALFNLMLALDRRCGRGQNYRDLLVQPAHHRDVAGVIAHAIFLLEAGLVRLVDDDQAKIGIRQEQRGARADDHPGAAVRKRPPVVLALGLFHTAVPGQRFGTEPGFKTIEKRLGQGDFRQQHQHLPVLPQGLGNGLEIDLGLARAGHAVEQKRLESRRAHGLDQHVADSVLVLAEINRAEVRQRVRAGGKGRNLFPVKHSQFFQPPDYSDGYTRLVRQFADRTLAVAQLVQCLLALRRHPVGDLAIPPIFADRPIVGKGGAARKHHPQHRCRRGKIIGGRPLDQPPQRCAQGRNIANFEQRTQFFRIDFLDRKTLGFPDNAGQLARTQRCHHDRARLDLHAVRNAVIERAQCGVKEEYTNTIHIHAIGSLSSFVIAALAKTGEAV